MTRLVYLLAASHSGTTLTAMLLGAHPAICSVGELKWTSMGNIERYRCSCGTLIQQCGFWADVREALALRGVAFEMGNPRLDLQSSATAYERRLLGPLHRHPLFERLRDAGLSLSPGWRRRLDEHGARNRVLMEEVLRRSGKQVLVDSSKIGLRLKYLLRAPGLDVKVIRVVRDGRAVALTYTDPVEFADARISTLRAGGSGGHRDAERVPMSAAAREWRRSNEEAASVLATLDPSRWIEVRYEDLCADPKSELQRMCVFIGVDPEAVTLDFRQVEHHVVGNGMRFDLTSDIQLDERWRTKLDERDLHVFASEAGALNRTLGYV